jgi:hypothetical protein
MLQIDSISMHMKCKLIQHFFYAEGLTVINYQTSPATLIKSQSPLDKVHV